MARKCPNCGKSSISFCQWGQGLNAFRTTCQHCGTRLKATPGTYVAAVICFLVVLDFIFLSKPWSRKQEMDWFTFEHGLMALIAIGVCGAASYFCGYRRAD